MGLRARVALLRQRIEAACERTGRSPESVELLPVSKRQPPEAILEAMAQGFRRFGENYVQEGQAKRLACPGAEFLLIGPLQRNKAKTALENFTEILTLDRPDLAARMLQVLGDDPRKRPVWIQVDLWDEATKQGGCPASAIALVIAALAGDGRLPLQGFMAIPPPSLPGAFSAMATLREEWQQRLAIPLRLSMGMSDDLEEAIEAGSDQVRIGTDFFGPR